MTSLSVRSADNRERNRDLTSVDVVLCDEEACSLGNVGDSNLQRAIIS